MTITKEGSGLLTDAEVEVAQRRANQGGLSEDEAVASVKSERVGPAALTDETPAANVPGGQIPPPTVNGPEETLERLYAQRNALNAEIAAVENDVDVRRRAYPQSGPATTASEPAVEPTTDETPAALNAESSDDDLAAANAADLVAFVRANPDQAGRVRDLELARDKPRSTVLDATGGPA